MAYRVKIISPCPFDELKSKIEQWESALNGRYADGMTWSMLREPYTQTEVFFFEFTCETVPVSKLQEYLDNDEIFFYSARKEGIH